MAGFGLEVDCLTKRYEDNLALNDVSLSVEPGEICGLLGPNGAGKTSLVSIIAGLRNADSGSVFVGGLDAFRSRSSVRASIGLAGQETGIYPTIKVSENLKLFAGLSGLGRADRAQRIEELAAAFELTGLMDRLGRNLSGGEKRRLHTAMALLHRPTVLLLDEPTTGVDVVSRSRLLEVIRRLAHEDGCTVLYSTHYLPEIEELGATVAILDQGSIITRGSLGHLIEKFGHGEVSITFDGPAPYIEGAESDDNCLTRTGDNGGELLGELITQLGTDASRVRSVEIHTADLESVFRTLTGRQYDPEQSPNLGEVQR